MNKKISLAIFLVIVLVSIAYFIYSTMQKPNKSVLSTVARVIDGDTVELVNGDVVRLLGIDAPEKDQPYHEEVEKQMQSLVGKQVSLYKDQTNKDSYGRLLRYIFLGDYFVNLELVKSGLVYAYVVSPDLKYANQFFAAEKYARENKIGVWNSSEFSDCIQIKDFHYNAKGDDTKNLNGEYVVFENKCGIKINIENWTLRDRGFSLLKFPKAEIGSGSKMTVYSGEGNNSKSNFYWNSEFPIWNNGEDALELRDSIGNLVLFESYQNTK